MYPAQFATPQLLAWTIRTVSGFICAAITHDIADRLELALMVIDPRNPEGPGFRVTVDAVNCASMGVGASDRANTLRALADPKSTPESFRSPGHILPPRAGPGVSEEALDLLLLARLSRVAAIAAPVGDGGELLHFPAILALGLPTVTFSALPPSPPAPPAIARVSFKVETVVSTMSGRGSAANVSLVNPSDPQNASACRSSPWHSSGSGKRAALSFTCAGMRGEQLHS
jgi:3,4-dihydroxy 2-butanone 4-phosphate synthase/GTP cyclohydrolase II